MANFVYDTFTDSNGTDLASHTGETGASWTEHPTQTGPNTTIQSNSAQSDSSASAIAYYASGNPSGADYDVTLTVGGMSGSTAVGGLARCSTSVLTGYLSWANVATNYQLYKVESGSFTYLAGYSQAPVNGDVVKLSVTDAAKKVYVNSIELISSSNNDITAVGKAGFRTYGGNVTVDNFTAYEAGGGDTSLTATAATHSHTGSAAQLNTQTALTATAGAHSHTAGVATCSQSGETALTATASTQGHTAGVAVLDTQTAITATAATHSHTGSAAQLNTQTALTATAGAHSHTAGVATCSQSGETALTATASTQGHTAGVAVLDTQTAITATAATHSHTADAAQVSAQTALTATASTHGHTAEAATCSQQAADTYDLTATNAAHSHATDVVALASHTSLTAVAALHTHAADAIIVSTQTVLVVQAAAHAHTVGTATCTIPGEAGAAPLGAMRIGSQNRQSINRSANIQMTRRTN